jgi:hypothetical protein
MGKRALLAAVLFGLLVAGLQVWLVSAILSRPLPSGKTGWEVIATKQAKRRSSDMPLVEGVSITYKCGSSIIGSSNGADSVRVRVNGPIPGLDYSLVTLFVVVDNEHQLLSTENPSFGPFPEEINCRLFTSGLSIPTGQHEIYWDAAGVDSGSTGLFLSIDHDTLPTFTTSTSYECNPGGIGVAEWTVSARVDNQPSSWRYELYSDSDATGSRIYAGSVNPAPSPPECSATMKVTGIPGGPFSPESVKLIATNANGTAETVVNLFPPVPESVHISADPTGILEGQDVTLHWSVGNNTSSAEIDNGVGTVYWIVTSTETSGSVTVSPTETTTYTITAYGGCAEVTASVKVFVQAVPRVQSAMIRLIAQEGLASTKTAQVDESAKMRLIANDLDRRPRKKIFANCWSSYEEVRTPHKKIFANQWDQRATRSKIFANQWSVYVPQRRSKIFANQWTGYATRHKVFANCWQSLYPDRMHVYARNTATGAVLDLGAIEMDAAELVLTDVAIPDGDWQFWTERESTFWKSNRSRDSQIVRLASGVPPAVDPLPAVINLAASVSRAVTTITWDVSHPIAEWGLDFGLWFSETSPVATFVTPTALVEASRMRTSYRTIRRQSGAEYVAVALIGADGTLGTAAEIELPWGTVAPVSPSNQTVGG